MENNTTSDIQVESSDITRIKVNDKNFTIIGTAHISQKSADLVKKVIEEEKPDTVCVELDEQRYEALSNKKRWQELDIKAIIKNKQLTTLVVNLILASYQKKLGKKLGVMPGTELMVATQVAKENDIPIVLCDRDVKITLKRAWNKMSFFQKLKFLVSGLAGVFEKQDITEEELEKLKEKDILNELMAELGKAMPVLKEVLIDERDTYITEKMRNAEGENIVAVVGAGHVNGIIEKLRSEQTFNLEKIVEIPPSSPVLKIIGWGIPVIIIGSLIYIGFTQGILAAKANSLYWILANGIPSAIGAIIALAHPLTIISVFFAAPLTSLTPVIGAGYVAAFVQAYFSPPKVKEFESLTDDFNNVKMWWKNRLLKVFLVFILTSLGSALGTYVGAYKIITNVF